MHTDNLPIEKEDVLVMGTDEPASSPPERLHKRDIGVLARSRPTREKNALLRRYLQSNDHGTRTAAIRVLNIWAHSYYCNNQESLKILRDRCEELLTQPGKASNFEPQYTLKYSSGILFHNFEVTLQSLNWHVNLLVHDAHPDHFSHIANNLRKFGAHSEEIKSMLQSELSSLPSNTRSIDQVTQAINELLIWVDANRAKHEYKRELAKAYDAERQRYFQLDQDGNEFDARPNNKPLIKQDSRDPSMFRVLLGAILVFWSFPGVVVLSSTNLGIAEILAIPLLIGLGIWLLNSELR